MEYFVLDNSGNQYGPADLATLKLWAAEGRVTTGTTLREVSTGRNVPASMVAGLFDSPGAPPPMSPPPSMTPTSGSYQVPPSYANPNYSQYPRGYGMQADTSKDLQWAWIWSILSLVCCGLLLGLLGVSYSQKVLKAGDERGRAPLVISYVGLVLWGLAMILRFTVLSRGF